jgi:hypothetical protein
MTAKTGSETVVCFEKATSFDTQVAFGAGDKMIVDSLNHGLNPEALRETGIGSGQVMSPDADQGATTPTVTITKTAKFNDNGVKAIALFMQGDTVTGMGASRYAHSMLSGAFNQHYATLGFQTCVGSVMEYQSGAVTSLTRTFENPPSYSKISFELLCKGRETTSATNDYDELEAVTLGGESKVVIRPSDSFLINEQSGGALSSGDRIAILSCVINLNKEHTAPREIKGSSGNGEPIPSGDPPFAGTLVITIKSLDSHKFIDAAAAGTAYKASVDVQGQLLGGGIYERELWNFPRLKLITDVDYQLASAGQNPITLTFECLAATANPTGMSDTTPYCIVVNDVSGAYV